MAYARAGVAVAAKIIAGSVTKCALSIGIRSLFQQSEFEASNCYLRIALLKLARFMGRRGAGAEWVRLRLPRARVINLYFL